MKSNQVYYIAVDGFNGASGQISLDYDFTPAQVYQVNVSAGPGGSVQVSSTNSAGGIAIMPGNSGTFAAGSDISFTATPDAHSQLSSWTGSITSTNNPLSTTVQSDLDVAAQFGSFPYTDGFESGGLATLPWATSGNAPWFVQSSDVAAGRFAARSGVIGNNQTSSLILSGNFINGSGSFDYKVSSETNFDFLGFFVDGTLQQQWSGEAGWATYTFNLSTNTHTLEWRYSKDPSISAGRDAAFIDDVILPIAPPAPPPAPAQLHLQRRTDGSLMLDVQGSANQQYILQTSTDLVHWSTVSTNAAVDGLLHVPIASGTNQAQFYRALAVPQ